MAGVVAQPSRPSAVGRQTGRIDEPGPARERPRAGAEADRVGEPRRRRRRGSTAARRGRRRRRGRAAGAAAASIRRATADRSCRRCQPNRLGAPRALSAAGREATLPRCRSAPPPPADADAVPDRGASMESRGAGLGRGLGGRLRGSCRRGPRARPGSPSNTTISSASTPAEGELQGQHSGRVLHAAAGRSRPGRRRRLGRHPRPGAGTHRHHRGDLATPHALLAQGGRRAHRAAGRGREHRRRVPGDGPRPRLQPAPARALPAARRRERRDAARAAQQSRPVPRTSTAPLAEIAALAPGVALDAVSVRDGRGLDAVRQAIGPGQTGALLGSSGRRQVDPDQRPARRGPAGHQRGAGVRFARPSHHPASPAGAVARRRSAHRHAGHARAAVVGRPQRPATPPATSFDDIDALAAAATSPTAVTERAAVRRARARWRRGGSNRRASRASTSCRTRRGRWPRARTCASGFRSARSRRQSPDRSASCTGRVTARSAGTRACGRAGETAVTPEPARAAPIPASSAARVSQCLARRSWRCPMRAKRSPMPPRSAPRDGRCSSTTCSELMSEHRHRLMAAEVEAQRHPDEPDASAGRRHPGQRSPTSCGLTGGRVDVDEHVAGVDAGDQRAERR